MLVVNDSPVPLICVSFIVVDGPTVVPGGMVLVIVVGVTDSVVNDSVLIIGDPVSVNGVPASVVSDPTVVVGGLVLVVGVSPVTVVLSGSVLEIKGNFFNLIIVY